jgi:hypothetical protein
MQDTVYIVFEDREVRSVYYDDEDAEDFLLRAEQSNPGRWYYIESYGVMNPYPRDEVEVG